MDPSQIQPGYRLDRYELLCPLAYGGMASVWLARFGGRLGFERLVVVKMILPQYSQDPRFQEMFLDEARIASKIEHGNVARILDVGDHDGNTFIVMEWVDGDSLSKLIRAAESKRETIPVGISLRVIADAAAGLHAAHTLKHEDGSLLGVVHRDVSPQNVLLSNAGATMIIDFGVAKARDRVSQDTSAGQLKGKIRYMAPEQALGRAIDHRADVWALGSMLYELCSGGNAPFEGPNEVATLHKLTSGQPPPPLPAQVPPPVRAIIDRALTYEAPMRYATALEMSYALEQVMLDIGQPTTTTNVAQYAAHLLADRKVARKKAVDQALAQSRARETGAPVPIGSGTSLLANGRIAPADLTPANPILANPRGAFPTPPPYNYQGPPLGDPMQAPMLFHGLQESPSAGSATLGSAAMEYPPSEQDPGRRRVFVNVGLAVSLVVGLAGAVLIANSALRKDNVAPAQQQQGQVVSDTPTTTQATQATTATTTAPTTPPPTTTTVSPTDPPVATNTTTTTNTLGTTATPPVNTNPPVTTPPVKPTVKPVPPTVKPPPTTPPPSPPKQTGKYGF